jgi:hypothetical protein
MKYICHVEEFTVKGPDNSQSHTFTSRGLMQIALDVPPEGGFRIAAQRELLKISDKIDQPGEFLELEDAEWKTLKTYFERTPWMIKHKLLVQLMDNIENAPEKKPEAA